MGRSLLLCLLVALPYCVGMTLGTNGECDAEWHHRENSAKEFDMEKGRCASESIFQLWSEMVNDDEEDILEQEYDDDFYSYDDSSDSLDDHTAYLSSDQWLEIMHEGTWHDIYDLFNCDTMFDTPRPVPNQSTWMTLRGVYHGLVGPRMSSITPLSYLDGFRVPFEVRHLPEKGRSLFSTGHVQKGDLIWTSRTQGAQFKSGEMFRRYLLSIPENFVCDILEWSWVGYDDSEDPDPYIQSDLDEGALMNTVGYTEGEIQNVGFIPELAAHLPGGCKANFFALVDIDAGQEFLCLYGDFADPEAWEWFGL